MEIMNRVQFDEDRLDFDGDQRIYDGVPLTGVSFEEYPEGQLKNEIPFIDGFAEGFCREWYSNGQLKSERFLVHGLKDGKSTEWHENGAIKSVFECDHGFILRYEEWTAQGQMIVSAWQLKRDQFYRSGEGKRTCWHENGTIKSTAEYNRGLELQYDEWTAQGELIVRRRIDTKSKLYQETMGQDHRNSDG